MRGTPSVLLLFSALAYAQAVPTVGTDPVTGVGAANSTAIWVHPTDASQSLVITGDGASGLITYGMDGHAVQQLQDGLILGVDVRYGMSLGGRAVDIVAAANQTTSQVTFYAVNASTRQLQAAGSVTSVQAPTQVALYAPASGGFYAFSVDGLGGVSEYALGDDGTGKVAGSLVRGFTLSSAVQGAVVDDLQGALFLAQSSTGLWRFPAAADAGVTGSLLDSTDGGHLAAPLAGLALYQASSGGGYLLASDPGTLTYAVYARSNGSYVTRFLLTADGGLDSPHGTAGISAMSYPLGPAFQQGLFVAQDSLSVVGTDFKYVPWNTIAATAGLLVDPTVDPRGGSGGSDGGGGSTPDGGSGGGGGPGGGRVGDAPPATGSNCGCGTAGSGAIAALMALAALGGRRRARRLICGAKPR